MFRLDELISALLAAAEDGHAVTDEASAMELAGQPVLLIPGSPANLKVTVAEDLELAAWYLSRQGEP
jgi:2-C-methyl-D-erythritol 4-phosphate cytidylyltransferase